MPNTIKIGFRKVYSNDMNVKKFFKKMPHVFNRFNLVDSNNPDFMFCGLRIPRGRYTRIYYNYENVRPDTRCEWSFGTDYEEEVNHARYMRHPSYVRNGAGVDLIKNDDYSKLMITKKRKFCAFIYSHCVPIRDEFFVALSKYRKVDAPGMCCNNSKPIGEYKTPYESRYGLGNFYDEKLEYLSEYKFVIAFENSSYPGYVSEKIYHAMKAGCIPIYWGNPLIHLDFNTDSFISTYDRTHKSTNDMFRYLIERIETIDKNDSEYMHMLSCPWYHNNTINKYVDSNKFLQRLSIIFGV